MYNTKNITGLKIIDSRINRQRINENGQTKGVIQNIRGIPKTQYLSYIEHEVCYGTKKLWQKVHVICDVFK